ncbi:SEC-C domain-containing protein [Rhodococcoides kyotonense]|uniref:SEC-C motif-containing protein n=1 Tax=Rhodococcoides kyotonense TaxID=398843 RepID=A0A239IMA6_9NOCA|nr:SEC-C domain-containing protein [Rhodococcus kyotonensis]SNS94522.1 SEC-C motif-containing protein [Rhodococcus kyotonensis]
MDDYEEIEAAALAILREHGPLTDDSWAELLVAQGHGTFREMFDLVEGFESDEIGFFTDDRNLVVTGMLEGRILTHRLTQREIASDIVEATVELTAIAGLVQAEGDTTGFEIILAAPFTPQKVFDDRGFDDPEALEVGLLLPRGTLDGYIEGELIGLYVERGSVRLRRVTEATVDAVVVDRLRAQVPDGTPQYVDSVVWQLMYENPTAFRTATLPLRELFSHAGLEAAVDHVAREGTVNFLGSAVDDYDSDEAAVAARLVMLAEEVASSDEERRTTLIHDAITETPDAWNALVEPAAASVALHLIIRMDGGAEALAAIAEALVQADLGLAVGAAYWLRGKALEILEDPAEAERSFEKAIDHDPWFEPAILELATFKSLRGDAEGAISFLDRMETELGDELRDVVQNFVPQEHPELGRNDRCWCGSGRKYKVCHLGKSEATLHQRALWLYHKAGGYIIDGRGLAELEELARLRYPDSDDPLSEGFADPFAMDVLLFEGGYFADFLETYGNFLPADELNLAQQWLLNERSVYDIESVDPGVGVSIRDIRTGDRLSVAEKTASLQLQPGQFVCTRVVPIGEELEFYGGVELVYPTQRTDLIALLDRNPVPPEELVEFLSARFAPPRVVTKQGDPMVVCEATFELGEVGNIKRKLSRRYGASRSGTWHWTVDGSLFGVLELDGTTLRINAMSEPRFDEMVDAVREMAPQAKILSESRTDAADKLAEPREPSKPVEPDPEILAILDERIRQHEASWIHESIPALDGYTPTQAAADPTRRDDLIRLLASFPDTGQPGTMSPSRLRAALGLDDGSSFWKAQKR